MCSIDIISYSLNLFIVSSGSQLLVGAGGANLGGHPNLFKFFSQSHSSRFMLPWLIYRLP